MAWTVSGIYVHTLREILRATTLTGGAIDLRLATYKIMLSNNTDTPNYSTATPNYSATNEVSGTGWAAGGVLLSAAASGATSVVPTLDEGTAGSIRYDHTNDVAVSGTTLTNAFGCRIYADPLTAPADMVDAYIVGVYFGGTGYSTNNGIFGITWAATGVLEVDLTP